MVKMDLFLSLSDELSRVVLQEWLKFKDLVRLDTAYLRQTSYPLFAQLLASCDCFEHRYSGSALSSYVYWLLTRSVKVSSLVIIPTFPLANTFVQYLKHFGSYLVDLEIVIPMYREETVDHIRTALMHCPNVVSLMLKFPHDIDENLLQVLNECCPKLQRLDLPRFDLVPDIQRSSDWSFRALKTLRLARGRLHTSEGLLFLSLVTPHLETLQLDTMTAISETVSMWPSLRTFYMRRTYHYGAFWPNLAQLTSLHLEGEAQFVEDDTLLHIAEHCRCLTELTLQSCEDVTDAGVCTLAEQLGAQLNTLTLVNVPITSDTLLVVSKFTKVVCTATKTEER